MLYWVLMPETNKKVDSNLSTAGSETLLQHEEKEASSAQQEQTFPFGIDIVDMVKAGVHFGQHVSLTHPRMKPYIFGVRNSIQIIDLEKTAEKLIQALYFIYDLVKEGKIILFVGTKPEIREIVQNTAQECQMPFIVERWLGGMFTNFPVIVKRIAYLKELEKKKEAGEWEKYTKKERMNFEEELAELQIKFGGIRDLERLPDAVFVCDMVKDGRAIVEARMKNISSIAICDTNSDPSLVTYPIPASDNVISSVKYILDKVKEVIIQARSS